MNAIGDLGRLQRIATFFLLASTLAAALVLAIAGRSAWIPSLALGALVALVNLLWLISPARSLMRAGRGPSLFRLTAMVRYAGVGGLLGLVLILGRAHPVAAIGGYLLLPISLMVAGYRIVRPGVRP
ncbi:MAG: ATP synthase subunit I [Candidatus Dormibacteraeota bacterium]|nr:ATP synthase subunit I [Candidatus Dormibacteraeota bacterium]